MNKTSIALVLLAIFSTVSCLDENSFFWDNCQDELIKFSIFKETASVEKLGVFGNLMSCLEKWYSDSEGREKCEKDAGIASTDEAIKNFYNNCVKPFTDDSRNECDNSSGRCASEIDKCTLCSKTNGCKTTSQMPKYADYQAINAGTETNCGDNKFSANCKEDTLKSYAYDICKSYYISKCSYAFYEANFQEDGCYDKNICVASSAFLKIAFISLVAFFTF